jgi:hypothetical protein
LVGFSCQKIRSKIHLVNEFVYIYKMKKIFFLTLCLMISSITKAQKVFSVEYASQADIKIYVADYESKSDLSVFKVDYESRAGNNDGNWFFVDYVSKADKKIFFVEYSSQADIIIFFVDYSSRAGWIKKEKIHLFY